MGPVQPTSRTHAEKRTGAARRVMADSPSRDLLSARNGTIWSLVRSTLGNRPRVQAISHPPPPPLGPSSTLDIIKPPTGRLHIVHLPLLDRDLPTPAARRAPSLLRRAILRREHQPARTSPVGLTTGLHEPTHHRR